MKVLVTKKFVFWYVRLVANNGKNLLVSETYFSKSNANRAARQLAKALKVKVEVSNG